MTQIIYSKFSNDRKKEYSLITKILSKEGSLFVAKEALDEASLHHVQGLVEIQKGLESQYEGSDFYIPQCRKTSRGIEMEYVEGKTFEEHFDHLLEEQGEKKCADEILEFLQELFPYEQNKNFKMTKEFMQVFGDVELPDGLHSFSWSDIDLIFPNIILSEKGKALIDYEWTYSFPVPMEYICFRCLHNYLDYDPKRKGLISYNLYEKMGITDEMIGCFWKMEESFQGGIYVSSDLLDGFHEKANLSHWKFPEDFENLSKRDGSYESGEFLRIMAELEMEVERQVEHKLEEKQSLCSLIYLAAKAYPLAGEGDRSLSHISMKSSMYAYDILFPETLSTKEIIFTDSDGVEARENQKAGKIVVIDYWMKDDRETTLYNLLANGKEGEMSVFLSTSSAKKCLQEQIKKEQENSQVLFRNYRQASGISMDKKKWMVWGLLVLLTILRIVLQLRLPIGAFPKQYADDGVMMDNAVSLLQGNYLGTYDSFILSKGISYPLFLAFTYLTGIPYGMMICLLNIVAAVVFLKAIAPVNPSRKFSLFLYVVLLYLPISLDRFSGTRVYRIGIMPAITLLLAALAVGGYIRRKEGVKTLLPWLVGEGVVLAFFYNIREDSIWIMPMLLVIFLLELGSIFGSAFKHGVKKIGVFVLPFVLLFVIQSGLKFINYENYGLAVLNDRSGSAYAKVLEDFYHIDGELYRGDVWVTQEMLSEAIDASETLSSIDKEIYENMEQWAIDGEVRGDLIGWALREAVTEAGYYEDAVSTNEFYENVHRELQAAFASGKLQEREGIYLSSQLQATTPKELVKVALKSLRTLFYDSTYYEIKAGAEKAQGSVEEVRVFEIMTGQLAVVKTGDSKLYYENSITVANLITKFYRGIGFITTFVSAISYLYITLLLLKGRWKSSKNLVSQWLIMTGFILSAYTLCFGVMMAMRWFVDSVNVWSAFYTSAVFPLIVIFKWMSMYVGIKEFKKK